MQRILVLAIVLTALAFVFALQNAGIVTVRFIAWQFDISLALLLLATFALGVAASILAALPVHLRKNRVIADQRQAIKELGDTALQDPELLKPTKFVQ